LSGKLALLARCGLFDDRFTAKNPGEYFDSKLEQNNVSTDHIDAKY
jgi:hypothetical protein